MAEITSINSTSKKAENHRVYQPRKLRRGHNRTRKNAVFIAVMSLGFLVFAVFTMLPNMVNRSVLESAKAPVSTLGKRALTSGSSDESNQDESNQKATDAPVNIKDNTWGSAQTNETRKQAQETLNQLLQLDKTLKDKNVEIWAKKAYLTGKDIAEQADQSYNALDYQQALTLYQETLAQFERIDASASAIAASAYDEAKTLMAQRQPLLAEKQAQIAHSIEPDNSDYEQQLTQAKHFQSALPLIVEAEALEVNGEITSAIERAQKAVDIDASLALSKSTLERLRQTQKDNQVSAYVSQALTFSDDQQFSQALNAIKKAKALAPQNSQLRQIEEKIQISQKDHTIQRHSTLAQNAEKQEQWQKAADFYQRILNTYPNLSGYQKKQRQAEHNAKLYRKLTHIITAPNGITKSTKHQQEARSLLTAARTLASPTSPKLNKKIDQLSSILVLANTPKPVYLSSDNKTEIVIYRVGKLGALNRQTLALNPGTYTFLGTRSGYRDVRLDITIGVNDSSKEITLICEEKISSS